MIAPSVLTSVICLWLGVRWILGWGARNPAALVAWSIGLVSLDNAVITWFTGSPFHSTGDYLLMAGLGFVGLSWRHYTTLAAVIAASFASGPLRHGTDGWGEATILFFASVVLSLLMQLISRSYQARIEATTRESERQREAAERALAQTREEIAHREQLQERLARAERLESLGLLAGGMAHDFNNLLAVVIGHATLALERGAEPRIRADLQAILDAGERAALLSRELLTYAGRGVARPVPLDLAGEVLGVCTLAQSSLPARAALRLGGVTPGLVVRADRGQLQQVVLNLLLNAGEATSGGGAIEVATGCELLGAEVASQLEPALAREAGEYCFVRVSDTGAGMSDETLRRVFEPFFTTKSAGRGLGLAASLGIARAHGGGFRGASRIGAGSEFTP